MTAGIYYSSVKPVMKAVTTTCYIDQPVQNQMHINSCAAHVCRELAACQGVDVPVLWAYYVGRIADGNTQLEDTGVPLITLLKAVQKEGVVPEEQWPFNTNQVRLQPPPDVTPLRNQIAFDAIRPQQLNNMLSRNRPVGVVVEMSDAFDKFIGEPDRYHYVYTGTPHDQYADWGHAMVLTGFVHNVGGPQGSYMARSSWGRSWGQCGTVYLPYSFVHDPTRCEQFCVARKPHHILGSQLI